jgi:hypothetical protein
VWECQNKDVFSLYDSLSNTSLEFHFVWIDHISIFEKETRKRKGDHFFCQEVHDILAGRPPSVERRLALQRSVVWENEHLWEKKPLFLDNHPHLEPPDSLCPFPYNTDIYRGTESDAVLFAPCEIPPPLGEFNGWFFRALVPQTTSQVACFLLDATSRATAALDEQLVYRCKGFVTQGNEPPTPYMALDCLLSAPLAPENINTHSSVEERGFWVLNQCF